jgi:DNA polymerase-3 subunit delta
MRIQFPQLAGSLARGLAPVYLVCGDEPLQLGEAAQTIREAARKRGFDERELLEQEVGFDWDRLAAAGMERSLFATRKLIELRLSGARIGREGSDAVRAYCERPCPDNLLLILAPSLDYKELKAKWVQTIERAGALLPVRQLEGPRLVRWIEQRMRSRGLRPGPGVPELLAERVEGNLAAAAQEVEKLALLYDDSQLDRDRLLKAISDSARYDLFDLSDAAIGGDRARVHRVLDGLAAEGTPEPLVLWALARELRMLSAAAYSARQGAAALSRALDAHRVWESRRGPVRKAIERLPIAVLHGLLADCAQVDRRIKGLDRGDPWLGLARIADVLAGAVDHRRIC